MQSKPFVDYYELLECSPNASFETIERLFRHLAKELHPDVSDKGDAKKFSELLEVFQTLRDPEQRALYDREYRARQKNQELAANASSSTMTDTEERTKILSALSRRRRNNMKNPGLSQSSLAIETDCSESAIEFHLWYFMQKGWVQREESGVLSITASGIDRIDEVNMALSQNGRLRIEG